MFGVGWTEMLVIVVVAMLLFGPKELPSVMRRVGGAVRAANKIRSDVMREVQSALREAGEEAPVDKPRTTSPKPVDRPVPPPAGSANPRQSDTGPRAGPKG